MAGSLPQVGVGAIVERDERVLLVRRGRPPAEGEWAIPGGRLHLGETLHAGAEREVREETGIAVHAHGEPLFLFEHIERDPAGGVVYHYVVIDFAADYLAGEPHAGDDASDARWVAFTELAGLPVNATTARALRQIFPQHFALPDNYEN